MAIEAVPAGNRETFDLFAYLHAHQGDIFCMLAISTLITIGHWRDWFYAEDLKLPDGSADPRAGHFNRKKAASDFFFVPSLVVLGLLILGFRYNVAMAGAAVAVAAFLGSAFIITTFEKARDGALGIFLQALTRYLGGSK